MTIEIYSVEGNAQKLDGGAMFGNAPKMLWQKWMECDVQNRILLHCRCLLIKFENKIILCETGIGAFFEPKLSERFGVDSPKEHKLLNNLEALGISRESVDYVILSHLHFDHAGGLLPTYEEIQKGNTKLVFPNAKILIGRESYERAKKPHFRDKASFIPILMDELQKSPNLQIIEKDKNYVISEQFSLRFSEGHTPGHMHTLLCGEKEKVFFSGDLIPGSAWVNLPITMGYDRFAEKLIDEKQLILEEASRDNWLLFFTHDPNFAIGRCRKEPDGRFSPYDLVKEVSGLKI